MFGSLRGEFVDIIEWTDDSRDTMVWRFPRHDNEIKMGARLVVRESQVAAFVNEGVLADVYPSGTYTLETRNMPILSTLLGWKHGFDSPFKAEVYFVNTRLFTFKWGTQNPIMMRDPEFGMVRLRAYGTFTVRVKDAALFLREVVGTDAHFRTEEVDDLLRASIVSRMATALASSNISVLDMAAHQQEIGSRLAPILSEDMAPLGVEIPSLLVESVTLPTEVEKALDARTSMGVLGDLGRYTQLQAANALGTAAANQGAGGAAVGAGVGIGLGAQLAAAVGAAQPTQAPPPVQSPPPVPALWYVAEAGAQAGPFAVDVLRARPGFGPSSLVWRPGMANWVPASDVPELAVVPPPLPPQ